MNKATKEKIMQRTKDKINPRFILSTDYPNISTISYVPEQIRNAYCFPRWAVGRGKTIAIIDAYGTYDILSEMKIFNERFNLEPIDLTVVYPQGKPIDTDIRWAIETSLDVQWAHALAPQASILLVISKTDNNDDIYAAVDYAVDYGADIVSMSWGSDEYKEELNDDYHFNVPGVAFLAASGDGGLPIYPSTSPYVVAVGGTSLQIDTCGNRTGQEIAWSSSTGGFSFYEAKPGFQYICSNANPQIPNRTTPDVSFFADSYPGVAVYSSAKDESGQSIGWVSTGGTSVATPCWAAILASTNSSKRGFYNVLPCLYSLYDFYNCDNKKEVYYDIKLGNNGIFPAIPGYDYVTGMGVPIVNKFIRDFNKCE